jgi:hypothetical protein
MLKRLLIAAAAVSALVVPVTAYADSPSLAQSVVACVYDASTCTAGHVRLAPGESVTFSKQQLADACKSGGYAFVGTRNQGLCVSFVEATFPNGVTVTGATSGGGNQGLASDGNGGLIAN